MEAVRLVRLIESRHRLVEVQTLVFLVVGANARRSADRLAGDEESDSSRFINGFHLDFSLDILHELRTDLMATRASDYVVFVLGRVHFVIVDRQSQTLVVFRNRAAVL